MIPRQGYTGRAGEEVIHGDAAPRKVRHAFIAAAIEAHLHLS